MDHAEAVQLRAAERYMLGELAPHVIEQFDQHYFSCSRCAQEVLITAAFLENLRAVLRERSPPRRTTLPCTVGRVPNNKDLRISHPISSSTSPRAMHRRGARSWQDPRIVRPASKA